MAETSPGLAALVAEELSRPAPAAALRLSEDIRRRHGDALAAVLFYGSCLRRQSAEGVLDFYAVVDDYAPAYGARPLSWVNALLPPNVFYLQSETPLGNLRAKYAVISMRDFARAASLHARRPLIWARFCQPSVSVWCRDAGAREAIVVACADAIRTAVLRGLPLLPDEGGVQQVDAESLWQALFAETYASELRAESTATIRGLYAAAADRYDRALRAVLRSLASQGRIRLREVGERLVVTHPRRRLAAARRTRLPRRFAARLLGVAQLLKTAFTFDDWVPYALWKLERHTGTRLEPSQRQRRRPLLFAWPLVWRVLRRRELR